MRTLTYVAGIAGCLLLSGCSAMGAAEWAGTGVTLVGSALAYAVQDGQLTQEVADAINTGVGQVAENAVTGADAATWGGTALGLAAMALRIWRGRPSKGLSKGLQNAVAATKKASKKA